MSRKQSRATCSSIFETLEGRQMMSVSPVIPAAAENAITVTPAKAVYATPGYAGVKPGDGTALRGFMTGVGTLADNSALDSLAAMGVNLLRVEIVGKPAEGSYDTWLNTDMLKTIKDALPKLAARHIGVIVDMHDPEGTGGFNTDRAMEMFNKGGTSLMNAFVDRWRSIVGSLGASPGADQIVGYDILNEPRVVDAYKLDKTGKTVPQGTSTADFAKWTTLANKTISAIAGTETKLGLPHKTVIVEPVNGSAANVPGRLDDVVKRHKDVAVSFHTYRPSPFADPKFSKISGQPDFKAIAEDNVLPANWKNDVYAPIKKVRDWQKEMQAQRGAALRIYVGEFSVASVPLAQTVDRFNASGRYDSLIETNVTDAVAHARNMAASSVIAYTAEQFEKFGWDYTFHAYHESPVWDLAENDSAAWAASNVPARFAHNKPVGNAEEATHSNSPAPTPTQTPSPTPAPIESPTVPPTAPSVPTAPTAPIAPSAPTNLSIANAWARTIDLNWQDASNDETGFDVFQSTDNVNFTQVKSEAADASSSRVAGLNPSTHYFFKVASTNAAGSGFSSTVIGDTSGEAPSSPIGLRTDNVRTTELDLNWQCTSSDQTGFNVFVSTDNVNYTLAKSESTNLSGTHIAGLNPSTRYFFKVAAVNAYGSSALSSEALADTPAALPAAPASFSVATARATTIDFNWSFGSANSSEFALQVSRDGVNFAEASGASPTDRAGRATQLSPGTLYFFRVVARNAAGTSDPSATLAVITATTAGAPANVSSFKVDAISDVPSRADTLYVRYYLAGNVDLQNAFGNDYAAATHHWMTSGLNEGGRSPNPWFNAGAYMARYADLRNAFGATNYAAATAHWIDYGLAEGRIGV